ncbi:DotA/TraY family protein [Paraburkholderia sp. BCC1885]|uniref:DotA/TraY family protein n=1 Tax=Paraburkholderia sp. BCC1885 TaxID=2562669 RepID=UPI001182E841|nr:DotA/TraY family protein [Paraburkholderia sp. BCC1885]
MLAFIKRICRLIALSSLFAVAGAAFAQTAASTQSIGSITNAASNGTDKSMSALQLIYGAVATNPLSGGGTVSSASSSGLISQVFLVLNSCILAVGVIWAMYHFGSAMIATGQDGEFLGQKKSSPWFIIRMGVGFTGLVPMFGGYCGAQIIMLWGTMMGVGVANLALSAAVSVLTSGGTLVATPVVPQVTTLAQSLFEANLCAQAANQALTNLPNDASVTADSGETFSPSTTASKIVLMNQNGLSCGGAEIDASATSSSTTPSASSAGLQSYGFDSTSSIASALVSAQQSALITMQSTLSSAAQTYVSAVNNQTQPTDPQATIENAAQAYQSAIQTAVGAQSTTINGIASTLQSNLTRDGWIMLGAWYESFAQANSQLSELAAAVATSVTGTDPANLPYPQLYQSVMASYREQIEQDASVSSTAAGTSTTAAVNNLYTSTNDPQSILPHWFAGQDLLSAVTAQLSGTSQTGANGQTQLNPLMGMKSLGDAIVSTGMNMLYRYAGQTPKDSAAVSTGQVTSLITAGSNAASKANESIGPFAVVMVITLLFFGVMLSVYMPMLPFIVWFSGVISWFMVVAEAMVASPLWAMTHLDGDGEGLGQRTQHGYVFLLNVMFRPVFMVFGFLLAGTSVVVLGTLLNTMFGVAMQNAQYSSSAGIVMMIGFIVLYVGMCQTLCNSAFSLIHVIPDNVFSWIGGQMAAANTGFEDGVKRSFDSGMNQGSSDAHSSAGSAPRPSSTTSAAAGRAGAGVKG